MARPESVLFLTQHYAPEEIGSAPYCVDIARWLVEVGFAVDVLTGQPQYPSPEIHEAFRSERRRFEREFGVEVHRVQTSVAGGGSVRRRIATELEFFFRGLAALVAGRVRRRTHVLSLSPSVFCVALGVLARRRGGRHVALIHDIQSGLAGGLGMVRSAMALKAMRLVERMILNQVDAIAVLTEEMARQLKEIGVTRPIEVIPLWVDTDAIVPLPRTADTPTVLYSGNFGRKQGLEQLVQLARRLQDRGKTTKVVVRGGGSHEDILRAEIKRLGLANMRIEPLVAKSDLNRGLAGGDVHLVPQNPNAADFAMPSKIFNIMAAGRPFVATAGPGSALWRLQELSHAFQCVPPDEPEALTEAVAALLDDPEARQRLGDAGRAYVGAHHARAKVLPQLGQLLQGMSVASEAPGRGIVVLEPSHEGHPQEWLEHIVRFALSERVSEPLRLVVAPQLFERLAALVPAERSNLLSIEALSARQQALCLHRSLVVSGFSRWWTMRRYLKRFGAARGHFLSLDHLSLPLALGLGANGCALDGVLFRPSVHYHELGDYAPEWRERVRDLRKSVLYRFMLLNRSVESILTLDPFFARYAVARYRGGAKVRPLADPVHWNGSPAVAARHFEVEGGRVRFLLFGYLAERKGVLALVTALAYLPQAIAARVSVEMAGSVDPAIRDRLRHAIDDVLHLQPTVRLNLTEGRLDEAELERRIDECDVVLAPYQRFVGSSGALIWAAGSGKPVLTQNFGLLHRLTLDYRLGLTADTTDPRKLAAAIQRLVEEGPRRHFDQTLASQFVRERSPQSFAAGILRRAS